MINNSIPYGRQNISDDDIAAVVSALKGEYLTQGPGISLFEKDFAQYLGVQYAVAVSNGTAALHLACLALNVNSNSNVITTPITFAASANGVRYCGGNIYFVDIDPDTFLIDIDKLRALITSKPKGFFHGIIPVDFAGAAVNLEKVKEIASEFGLWIIEDACHAPGGYFTDSKGEKQLCGNGNYADLSVFSFHPVKHIATGEGGMITTNNNSLYKRLLTLRTHGITRDPQQMSENHGGWYYEMQELGYNYRLTDIQAALGVSQLKKAPDGMLRRKAIAKKYASAFSGSTFINRHSGYVDGHAYHLYVIHVNDRASLYEHLRKNNIFAQVHYIPVHTLPYYQNLGFRKGDFTEAENYYDGCLSLPMYAALTDSEQDYVIDTIKAFYR